MEPSGRTLIQRAISILRRFGQDAHIYLPGVGMLNGLQAGNYLDSAGTTAATVDQPVGLVLDAAGGLGVELVTNGGVDVDAIWGKGAGWSIGGGFASCNGTNGGFLTAPMSVVAGKTYSCTYTITARASGAVVLTIGDANGASYTEPGTYTAILTAVNANPFRFYSSSFSGSIDNISVREVTGIAASQPTTANKSVLKLTNGRYNWLFDSTDLLTATYPAGYESVTVIDARSTGQVTTAGANIVGAYNMGPSVTLYGRMIIRVAVPPSDLALLQGFANRLAGL